MEQYTEVIADRRGNVLPNVPVLIKTEAGAIASLFAESGGAAIANPVISDTNGRITFAAANGTYTGITQSPNFAPTEIPPFTLNDPAEGFDVSTINVLDYAADNTGAKSASAAIAAAWLDVKEALNTTQRMVSVVFKIPPGIYLANETVNLTGLWAWNVRIEAAGAVIVAGSALTGKPIVDMTGLRGVTCDGLSIYGGNSVMASCALLLGPGQDETCGNNRFSSLKTDGYFSKAAVWNIGSETTLWDFCYFQNRAEGVDKYAYIADSLNRFGAASAYTETRSAMTWASLTSNTFYSCRFANYGGGPSTYLESVFNWSWDVGCYHLTFGDSGFVIRCSAAAPYRSTNLKIEGLFETFAGGAYGGMKDCVRLVADTGLQTDIKGFYLNAGQPQSKRSIVRAEDAAGADLVAPAVVKLNNAEIIVGNTVNLVTTTPVFSGPRIMVQGDIKVRTSPMVNLDILAGFQGMLYTQDFSQIIQPGAADLPFSFIAFDETTNSGRVIRIDGVGTGLGFHAGIIPEISAQGAANASIAITPNGTGGVLIGAAAQLSNEKLRIGGGARVDGDIDVGGKITATGPVQVGGYMLATLPSAATFIRHLIIVTDATGGPALCRSNGTAWVDLHTKAAVA